MKLLLLLFVVGIVSVIGDPTVKIHSPSKGSTVRLGNNGFRIDFEVLGNVKVGTQYAIYLNESYVGMIPLRSLREQTWANGNAGECTIGIRLVDEEGEIIDDAEDDVQFVLVEPESIEDVQKRIMDLQKSSNFRRGRVDMGSSATSAANMGIAAEHSISDHVKEINDDMDVFLKKDPDIPVDGSAFGSNRLQWFLLLTQHPSIKTICETGFNFGMSARAFLQWGHVEKVYSFDLMDTAFKYRAQEMLQRRYGDRLEVFAGPTKEQLPKFVAEHPHVKCDLVFIDGGHTGNDSEIDILALRQVSKADTVLIADDCSCDDVAIDKAPPETKQQIEAVWFAWQRMRKMRVIQHLGSVRVCINGLGDDRDDYTRCFPDHYMCFGKYLSLNEQRKEQLVSHMHSLINSN